MQNKSTSIFRTLMIGDGCSNFTSRTFDIPWGQIKFNVKYSLLTNDMVNPWQNISNASHSSLKRCAFPCKMFLV